MISKKILIKNGYVITMDSQRTTLSKGEVLIGDDKILAVGHNLPSSDAEVIDAEGGIIMPGFVDNHRHMWQTNLRAMLTDWTLHEYMRGIRFSISPVLRAEDIGAGNYIGALEALNAGVTTVFDYSHSNNSPDHATAGVEALIKSGMRAVYGYGLVPAPVDHPAFQSVEDRIKDAERIHDEYLSSTTALVTMGMALTETGLLPWSSSVKEIMAARNMNVPMSIHNNNYFGVTVSQGVVPMYKAGLLGPDQIHVHCNTSTPDEFRMLADNGCTIVSTPDTEIQMGMGTRCSTKPRNTAFVPQWAATSSRSMVATSWVSCALGSRIRACVSMTRSTSARRCRCVSPRARWIHSRGAPSMVQRLLVWVR